jgi:hypothetical protein
VLIAAIVWATVVFRFVNDAEIAQGSVSNLHASGSHPEIVFTTREGKRIHTPQGGSIFGYRVGDQVSMYYDPKEPQRATLKSFGALWGFACLAGILGVVLLSLGLQSIAND